MVEYRGFSYSNHGSNNYQFPKSLPTGKINKILIQGSNLPFAVFHESFYIRILMLDVRDANVEFKKKFIPISWKVIENS